MTRIRKNAYDDARQSCCYLHDLLRQVALRKLELEFERFAIYNFAASGEDLLNLES